MIRFPMAAPVSPGDTLAGKYRVDRVLGEGGMGVVVAATDIQLERKVAIKFLLPEYSQHHEAAQRFLREARAAVKIQSEHVARVIDVGTMEGGAPYMVMEYLEGRDLARLLEEERRATVEDAVSYVLEACDAIAEAHSVGIVHRDLKPANLFLARTSDGSLKIKVLDFGISKAMMTTTGMDPSLTRTSSMMGSPLYMSPEQMKSAKNVDPRTDVWALGVILYELLLGEPPFYAESIPELSAKVLLEEPVSIRSRRADVRPELEAVVKRALAKDPGQRYQNVADFALALMQFGPARTRVNVERAGRVLKTSPDMKKSELEGASSSGGPATARTAAAWTEQTREPQKKGKGAVIGAVVAVAVLAGGASFFVLGRNTPAPAVSPSPVAQPAAESPIQMAPEPRAAPAPIETAKAEPSSVASATAEPTPSAQPPALVAAPGKRPAVAPRPAPQKPKPGKPEPVAAPAPDPFGGFGSRK
jgi:eukaryotic-like serine/threonine-protein kinase